MAKPIMHNTASTLATSASSAGWGAAKGAAASFLVPALAVTAIAAIPAVLVGGVLGITIAVGGALAGGVVGAVSSYFIGTFAAIAGGAFGLNKGLRRSQEECAEYVHLAESRSHKKEFEAAQKAHAEQVKGWQKGYVQASQEVGQKAFNDGRAVGRAETIQAVQQQFQMAAQMQGPSKTHASLGQESEAKVTDGLKAGQINSFVAKEQVREANANAAAEPKRG